MLRKLPNVDELRDKYAGADCLLDGKPAQILGRRLDIAIVAQVPRGLACEWSWHAVDHVMTAGGGFQS